MTEPLQALATADLVAWIRASAALIDTHADELTELDAAIGDADHGANMRRGLLAAVETLEAATLTGPDAVLKQVAMVLISKVGGTSGPLYGTFFLRAATAVKGKETLELDDIKAAFAAGLAGIQARGHAQAGEKTMLDAWIPALEAFGEQADLPAAVSAGAAAADAGRAATEPMLATKGRASYLGERSIGHIDPGAASTALLWQALEQVVSGGAQ